jgi:Na+/proline symporter
MMHAHVNYPAVLAAAIAAMIVGFVWYSQALFGRMWMKIIGKENLGADEQEQMKKDVRPHFLIMFFGTLIGAFVFALFIRWLHAYTAFQGMQVGFWAWLAFIFPVTLGTALFSGKDMDLVWPLFLVQAGHSLAGMLVMGAILGAWR